MSTADAQAGDLEKGHSIWIELGGVLEHLSPQNRAFAPPFVGKNINSKAFDPVSPIEAQHSPRFSKGGEVAVTFVPRNSEWRVSASVLYGRANGDKHVHNQTNGLRVPASSPLYGLPGFDPPADKEFADTKAAHYENHTIVDFAAGKDVGLGMFGHGSSSVLNFGIRFAQFTSKADVEMKARPHIGFQNGGFHDLFPGFKYFNNYATEMRAERSFHGIGPSLSWSNSLPVFSDNDGDEVTLDWDVNAAALFGRQKADTQQSGYAEAFAFHTGPIYTPLYTHPLKVNHRSRSVVVPNLGGFAGLSLRYNDAHLSIGYRGDFFLGASDIGLDRRRSANQNFYGPFAKISIGL